GELQASSCRFASALLDIGIRPEERLALLLYDTVDFPVAFWGSLATAGPPVLSFRRRLPRCWPPFSTACPACARSLSSAATPRIAPAFPDALPMAATCMTSPMW